MTHNASITLAYDIGGSHVSAALINSADGTIVNHSAVTAAVDAAADAETILAQWQDAGSQSLAAARSENCIAGIGIAMPGPFEYDQGICRIKGLSKYESLYGVNVRSELRCRFSLPAACPIIFRNDAACFLLGEQQYGAARGFSDVFGITLGTGFGSAFMRGGEVVETGAGVPPKGWLYNAPFRDATADDAFSTRGLLSRLSHEQQKTIRDGRELAKLAQTDTAARDVFQHFGKDLAEFLAPWIQDFQPQCAVIGGSLAKSWDLFCPAARAELTRNGISCEVRPSAFFEEAALRGAAILPLKYAEPVAAESSHTPPRESSGVDPIDVR